MRTQFSIDCLLAAAAAAAAAAMMMPVHALSDALVCRWVGRTYVHGPTKVDLSHLKRYVCLLFAFPHNSLLADSISDQ